MSWGLLVAYDEEGALANASVPPNDSAPPSGPTAPPPSAQSLLAYEQAARFVNGCLIPTFCLLGTVGNVIIVLIVLRLSRHGNVGVLERSTNCYLVGLALSDLFFCLTAFPSLFLEPHPVYQPGDIRLFYALYCAAVINIFICCSTWLITTMSLERIYAVCWPLRAKQKISTRRTWLAIGVTGAASVVFNWPVFYRYEMVEQGGLVLVQERMVLCEAFDRIYRTLWSIAGNFVPLVVLSAASSILLYKVHQQRRGRFTVPVTRPRALSNVLKMPTADAVSFMSTCADTARRPSLLIQRHTVPGARCSRQAHHVTVMLLSVVFTFLLLVAPSEVIRQFFLFVYGENAVHTLEYRLTELIFNLTQTISFSTNCVLYVMVNPLFRRSICSLSQLMRHPMSSSRADSRNGLHGDALAGASCVVREPPSPQPVRLDLKRHSCAPALPTSTSLSRVATSDAETHLLPHAARTTHLHPSQRLAPTPFRRTFSNRH